MALPVHLNCTMSHCMFASLGSAVLRTIQKGEFNVNLALSTAFDGGFRKNLAEGHKAHNVPSSTALGDGVCPGMTMVMLVVSGTNERDRTRYAIWAMTFLLGLAGSRTDGLGHILDNDCNAHATWPLVVKSSYCSLASELCSSPKGKSCSS